MAAKTEKLSFDLDTGEAEFEVRQLPPTKAFKLAGKLGRLFGPALPELMGAVQGGAVSLATADMSKLGGGLEKLLANLDDQALDGLISDLLSGIVMTANGKRVDLDRKIFELQFTGHLRQSFQLLAAVVKVNFLDFIQGQSAADK